MYKKIPIIFNWCPNLQTEKVKRSLIRNLLKKSSNYREITQRFKILLFVISSYLCQPLQLIYSGGLSKFI